ncbi:hypothetical protein MAQ5080_01117 [Marinomonas aquimarina]|uniref:Uncharacterized protein n=1 Tax=Marinomonas aquimarina TaxID=295068 RepID=A0A1A8T847_9GAMM|nr:hypothetical protein [Marinomonas aquimarina]SBS28507.1 hypothetical protein MAQ5080_01117 [Marinomonas aquimarina]
MKIIIRKKHLGSLSSLLMLSLFHPSASAETDNNAARNAPSYAVHSANEIQLDRDTTALKVHWHTSGALHPQSSDMQHVAYKTDISKAFNEYYLALHALEEDYQDKVDDVLDEYEQNVKTAQLLQQAKKSAQCLLTKLKQQHHADREALKLKHHIS